MSQDAAAAKAEARKQIWMQAEAKKLSMEMQAKEIANLVDCKSAEKVKSWIQVEVDLAVRKQQDKLQAMVDEAVVKHGRSIFDAHADEDHFELVHARRASGSDLLLIEPGTRPPSRAAAPIQDL